MELSTQTNTPVTTPASAPSSAPNPTSNTQTSPSEESGFSISAEYARQSAQAKSSQSNTQSNSPNPSQNTVVSPAENQTQSNVLYETGEPDSSLSSDPFGRTPVKNIPRKENGQFAPSTQTSPTQTTQSAPQPAPQTDLPFADLFPTIDPAAPQKPRTRDEIIATFPPDKQPLLRAMSNDAFNYVAPLLKEYHELKETLPKLTAEKEAAAQQALYQNPNAYTLLPEYTERVIRDANLGIEEKHWLDQLLAAQKGEPWTVLEHEADENKRVTKYVYGATYENPTPEHINTLRSLYEKAKTLRIQNKLSLDTLKSSHETNYKTFDEQFQTFRKNITGHLQTNNAFVKPRDELLSKVPPLLRVNPQMIFAAECLTLLDSALKQNAQLKASANASKLNTHAEANTTPKASTAASSSNNSDSYSYEAFRNYLRR